MNNFPDIVINIAVGGCVDDNTNYKIFEEQVGKTLNETIACAQGYNNSYYNYSGTDVKVNFFSSLSIVDTFWADFADRVNTQLNVIVPFYAEDDSAKLLLNKVHSVTNINSNRKYSTGRGLVMPDWIADQVDLSIILWDGNENFNDCEIWSLIQACKRNNIPSVWVDINSPKDVYWISDSYFDMYTADKLKVYIAKLFCKDSGAFNPPNETKIPFWKLWNCLYNRFMKKYKAKIQPFPYIDDKVMSKNFIFNDRDKARDLSRLKVVSFFEKFDNNAIAYSHKYRTSIYLRSIMPFIVTIFLSIGFYTESVLVFIFGEPTKSIGPWAILSGVGFLLHGFFNYYMYNLSENPNIASWHLRFIDNRFIAEVLRLTAHFTPFGIPVNYISSLNRFGNKISKTPHVSNELRRITRSMERVSVTFDRNTADELFDNLTHMINDQIVYQEHCNKRYTAITSKLKKLTASVFVVGLTIVVLRGGLQFVLVYVKSIVSQYDTKTMGIIGFIKSFANMLALILPAWASYFSLKLSLSNFEGLMNNSMDMKNGLAIMKKIIEDEKKKADISFERIYTFSKDLTKLMLGEVVDWYSQISSQKLTKL